ncbi:MAG: hypothetical protein ACN6O6_13775 [Pseudomonas sp.]|uniref:hypothetical protein n=1 Tax=Pseudomonas sp. TaxID=306 RepID=UPI003D0C11C7
MFVLLESTNRPFIDHLQVRMTDNGITCLGDELSKTPDGNVHFALKLPMYSQMQAARTLLYRNGRFLRSLHPNYQDALLQVRQVPRNQLLSLLSSPWAVRAGALCLAIALLGYLVEWLA